MAGEDKEGTAEAAEMLAEMEAKRLKAAAKEAETLFDANIEESDIPKINDDEAEE